MISHKLLDLASKLLISNFFQILRVQWINPYHAGTELSRFNKVNIMAAGALAPYVAKTSAAMILTM